MSAAAEDPGADIRRESDRWMRDLVEHVVREVPPRLERQTQILETLAGTVDRLAHAVELLEARAKAQAEVREQQSTLERLGAFLTSERGLMLVVIILLSVLVWGVAARPDVVRATGDAIHGTDTPARAHETPPR